MSFNPFKSSPRVRLLIFMLALLGGCRAQDGSPAAAGQSEPQGSPPPLLKRSGITYEDRKAWREVLKWPDECEEAFDYPDKSLGGIEVYRLADGQYLVEVTCTLGAYQGYQLFYFYDETAQKPEAALLAFESRESQDGDSLVETRVTEVWGEATFDESTKELRVFNRFRGPGDCGILATYEFVGREPKLKELRAKPACDGNDAGGPEKWKRVALR